MKSYKSRWTNKESGYAGIGNVLTKTIDVKGKIAQRAPLNFNEAEELCKYANKNYKRARHVVIEVYNEN